MRLGAIAGLLAALMPAIWSLPALADTDLPVGRILSPRGPLCTGVLVAPKAVLTAAHCMTTKAGDGFYSAGLIHFAMPDPDGDGQLYALGDSVERSDSFAADAKASVETFRKDWALLRLDRPIAAPPVPLWQHWQAGIPERPDLFSVAYGSARTLTPSVYGDHCIIATQSDELLFHTCVVEQGSSGSVLFLRRDGQTFVLAINVGLSKAAGIGPQTVARLVPPHIAKAISAPE